MLNLDHAFTGCVQKDFVSVRLGVTGVIHYIYNHWGLGWGWACAQSRPCLHWLCTKDIVLVEIRHHRCYSLHTQSSKVRTGLRLCSISTMPILVVYIGYSGHVRQYMCYLFTYTIIWVFGRACACAQSRPCLHWLCTKDIVSVMMGVTGVIHYIYNNWGFGRVCACAQSRSCLHWLC